MRFLYVLAVLACSALALFGTEPPPVKEKPEPPAVKSKRDGNPSCSCERPNRLNQNPPPCSCDDCPVRCFPIGNGAADLSQSSVYVSVDLGGGRSAGGTGTVIATENGRSLVLTNAHVVPAGSTGISVTYWSGGKPWKQEATYLGGSSVDDLGPGQIRVNGPDLALLSVQAALPAVEIADTIPATGTSVTLYGFGGAGVYGTVPLKKTGHVMPEPGWTEPATRTSIVTVNGDSGSGILNDAGQLVAVHWGGGAVRLDSVHSFTVRTLNRVGLFQRLKDRLAARRIAKAVASAVAAQPASPPPVKAPAAPAAPAAPTITLGAPCANGQCPSSTGRRP